MLLVFILVSLNDKAYFFPFANLGVGFEPKTSNLVMNIVHQLSQRSL